MVFDQSELKQLLTYLGGIATAGGAFGTWYLRFRQGNTSRQKNQLDHHTKTLGQTVQLQTVELEYITKARQGLDGQHEKHLGLYEQELIRLRETNSKLEERSEVLQQRVITLESDSQSYQPVIRHLQDKVQQLKEEINNPRALDQELKRYQEVNSMLKQKAEFLQQQLNALEAKSYEHKANSQRTIRHLQAEIRQLRTNQ